MYNPCSLLIQVMTFRTIASTLKMQIWIATNNKDVPRVMKTKFPATVIVFRVVSSHIMPPHIFDVGLKVNTKVYLDVVKSVVISWCNQVVGGRPWVWQQDSAVTHKRPRHCFRRSATTLYPSLTGPPPPPTWTRWTTSFGHTSRTSPTWPPTTPKPAWSPPSAELLPSSRWRLWKRHAPSSGSVSRQWLRLKAVTMNRCQLYYIIKWPELIFLIKVLKYSCCVVFFRTTLLSFHPVQHAIPRLHQPSSWGDASVLLVKAVLPPAALATGKGIILSY